MKKNLTNVLIKMTIYTLYTLRVSFLFLILGTCLSFAEGQNLGSVHVHVKNEYMSVGKTLKLLDTKTDFRFTYSTNRIAMHQKVRLPKGRPTVKAVLNALYQQANLTYYRRGKQVYIRQRKPRKTKVAKPQSRSVQKVTIKTLDRTITGQVIDAETKEALAGATVQVKGTAIGTATDVQGNFRLLIPDQAQVLMVKFIGFVAQEVQIGTQTTFNIILKQDFSKLNEVVVTALNVKRQQKSIGYSTQRVSGAAIREASEPNLLNALSGKVAGAQITNTSGGVGASSTIVLRGYNSLSGRNQPLFIVDGIPISNEIHQTSRVFGGPSNRNQSGFFGEGRLGGGEIQVDYGNAAAEINPQDIADIQILKGATASALYGTRAANGVILITTKSGRGQKGLGVSVNTNISFQNPLKTPKFQTTFGKGSNGLYAFPNLNADAGRNFGPRFSGQNIAQYDPRNPATPRNIPWVNRLGEDPIRDFLETGVTQNYNVSVTNGTAKSNFRLSYSRLDQKGMVPNTNLKRNYLSLNSRASLNSRLTIGASMNYVNGGSDNRPEIGAKNESNIFFTMLKLGTNESLNELKNYWEPFKAGERQATSDRRVNNPYFLAYENLNGNSRNRMFGNVQLNYDITDELSLQLRTGRDFYRDNRTTRKAFSHFPYVNGFYSEASVFYLEDNSDILLTFEKKFGNFSVKAIGGANRLNQRLEEIRASTDIDGLVIPGLYSLSNSRSPVIASNFLSRKRINSVYGGVTIGLNDYLFLDITGRNDWSSTLPKGNNSFFYPSVSLSAVITDMLHLRLTSPTDFIKARLSYSEVGNDTDPYQTNTITVAGRTTQGISVNSVVGRLGNAQLKPENIVSMEAGIEASLFNNRISFDATIYTIENRQQIAVVPIATESGFLERTINVPASIKNRGVEISATFTPIKFKDFQWDITANWSRNTNKVSGLNLSDDERITLAERWINLDIRNGGSYGDFYGDYLLKVDQNGKLGRNGVQIYRPDGRAEESDDVGTLVDQAKPLLGNGIPDWIAGINNQITYKNFSFSFLVDINKGGQIHSRTYVVGNNLGALAESATLFERDNPAAAALAASQGQTVVPGEHWVTLNGAFLDKADGNITPAEFAARSQNVYRRYFDNDAIGTFDRTFVKLREVKFSYRLPNRLTKRLLLQNATLTLYGRNLFLWDNVPHVDPEAAGYSGELIGGEFFTVPTPRSYGFSVSANF